MTDSNFDSLDYLDVPPVDAANLPKDIHEIRRALTDTITRTDKSVALIEEVLSGLPSTVVYDSPPIMHGRGKNLAGFNSSLDYWLLYGPWNDDEPSCRFLVMIDAIQTDESGDELQDEDGMALWETVSVKPLAECDLDLRRLAHLRVLQVARMVVEKIRAMLPVAEENREAIERLAAHMAAAINNAA